MFEKEAEERARELEERQTLGIYDREEYYERDRGWNEGEVAGYEEGFQDGATFGYNKAKEEMQKNGLALQSDMDKTIEQNITLKGQIEKMKSCSNCIHYSSTFGLCHYSMGDEDYDCRGRKWEKMGENGR